MSFWSVSSTMPPRSSMASLLRATGCSNVRPSRGLLLIASTMATAAVPLQLAREIARQADGIRRLLGFALERLRLRSVSSRRFGLRASGSPSRPGLSQVGMRRTHTAHLPWRRFPRWLPPGSQSIRASGDACRVVDVVAKVTAGGALVPVGFEVPVLLARLQRRRLGRPSRIALRLRRRLGCEGSGCVSSPQARVWGRALRPSRGRMG